MITPNENNLDDTTPTTTTTTKATSTFTLFEYSTGEDVSSWLEMSVWIPKESEEDTPKQIEVEKGDSFTRLLNQLYKEMSKTDTMNLEWEQQIIIDNMSYLKFINLFLIKQLKEMHIKFKNLQSESNKRNKDLKDELNLLRNEIKEIESVRSFKFEIPESWIIEE